jgi:excisionase family DNA binding protein
LDDFCFDLWSFAIHHPNCGLERMAEMPAFKNELLTTSARVPSALGRPPSGDTKPPQNDKRRAIEKRPINIRAQKTPRRFDSRKRSAHKGDDGDVSDGNGDGGSRAPPAPSDPKPLVVKPRNACVLLGCGVTYLYDLINSGELESFKDGKSRKITTASIEAYIARRLEASKEAAR